MTIDIHPEYSKHFDRCMCASWCEPEDADYEHEAERRGGARRATKVLAALLVIFLAAGVVVANAADLPRAKDPAECRLIADVVWAAAALRKNEIAPAASVRVLLDFYKGTSIEDRLNAYIPAAMLFAERYKAIAPNDLGNGVYAACHQAQGHLAPIFGTGV